VINIFFGWGGKARGGGGGGGGGGGQFCFACLLAFLPPFFYPK